MEHNIQDWVQRKTDEEFHPDCINYKKCETGTEMMFWGGFKWGKIGPGIFFDLEDGQKVNSTIYRNQIWLEPLKEFQKESFRDIIEPIVMEDNTPVYKKMYIPIKQKLGMRCH